MNAEAHPTAPAPGLPTAVPIVVGVDGSAGSVAALAWAAREAAILGCPVTVVHATDPILLYANPYLFGGAGLASEDLKIGEQVLDEALAQVYGDKHPQGVARLVREGDPARVLIAAADQARMLVVGARGHGHFLLGSVSDRCVHHAPCSVVVVR